MGQESLRIFEHRPTWMEYLRIARLDHWIKNIFLLPGVAIAMVLQGEVDLYVIPATLFALASLCLIASANYTINEYLDSEFDRFHPRKRERPGARGRLDARFVAVQYMALSAVGLFIAAQLGIPFLVTSAALLSMGIIYNVEPMRTKDRPFLDVLSESINNPLRLLMGWFIVIPESLPPSSLILAYWMGGAFLMAMKRFSEYRWINDPEIAGLYRRSFRYYTENKLLLSSFFYALLSSFLAGVFLVKYRIEYLLTFPLLALLFTWYLAIALRAESAAQAPEKLHKERRFMAFAGVLAAVLVILTFVDLPMLDVLMRPVRY